MSAAVVGEDLQGIVLGLDESTYHAHPALSSTGARRLLEAPQLFDWMRRHPQPAKKEFDVGTVAHSKILGVGAQAIAYPAEKLASNGAASTAAAKQWAIEQRATGLVPVKQAELDEVNAMAESVLRHPSARLLLEQEGAPEASVFGTDPATGVDTRARFDFLGRGAGKRVGVDLKTLHGKATPAKFAKTIADHGYHIQAAHYEDTLQFVGEGIDAFAFIAIEKDPPYLTAVFVLDEDWRDIGHKRAAEARELFRRGLNTGTWPGYPDQIQVVRPPNYVIFDQIDRENAA